MFDFICYDSELFETEFEICGNFTKQKRGGLGGVDQ